MKNITYKQSENEEVPKDWAILNFGSITENYDSQRVPLSKMQRQKRKGSYPYYGASGIIDYIDDFIYDGKFLLISEDGENLRSRKQPINFIVNGKFWVNNHAHIIKSNDKSNLEFIHYWFLSNSVSKYLSGSVQPKLSQVNLNRIQIACPHIDEQKQIASILSSLDDKIELNRKMNKTLEEMGKTLFKRWFVDFEFPDKNGRPYKSSGGEMVESELGDIPKEWQAKELGDVIEINTKSINPSKNKDELFWHFSIPAYDQSGYPTLESGSMIKSNKTQIKDRSILVSKLNPKQERRIWGVDVSIWDNPAISSTEFINFVPNKNDWAFTNFLFRSDEFYFRFADMSTGSTGSRQRVRPTEAKNLRFIYPEEKVRISFNELVEPLLSKINANLHEIKTLIDFRDSLLPRLMSGKLRVN